MIYKDTTNQDCPFCNIPIGKMIKKGFFAYVIFSNPRLMPGHLLVIPERHVTKISHLSKEESEEILNLLSEFQEKILKKLASGCDIRQNFKPYLENSKTHVNHMHFHLLLREVDDELQQKAEGRKDPIYQELTEEETKKVMNLLS